MTATIDIRPQLSGLQRAFGTFQAKQLPFTNSLALNALAKGVVVAESDQVTKTFDTPTPFTVNAFRIEVATKSRQYARVAAKDIQAEYLAPYVVGGDRFLGAKRGMLAPRAISLNQYGNLSKGKLAALKGKPGVFIGAVKTKSGRVINGVWQRPVVARGGRRARGSAKPRSGLKLLIQFEDTTKVRKHFPFTERAGAYVKANAQREYQVALRRALATAR